GPLAPASVSSTSVSEPSTKRALPARWFTARAAPGVETGVAFLQALRRALGSQLVYSDAACPPTIWPCVHLASRSARTWVASLASTHVISSAKAQTRAVSQS